MTSYIYYPATNTTNATYVFAIPPNNDKDTAIASLVLSLLPFFFLPFQIYKQHQEKKNKPKKEPKDKNSKSMKKIKFWLISLLLFWLISTTIGIIDNFLFLYGEYLAPNKDNTVINSIYSFWFIDINFAISFGTIVVIYILWMRIIIGINKHKEIHVPGFIRSAHYPVFVLFLLLLIGTIACLAAIGPYCFPAFQRADLNQECVEDNANQRIYDYRWAIFGIRLFVVAPLFPLMLYIWKNLRPVTENHPFLFLYRQMTEVLLVTQLLLYIVQTLSGWVLVYYPNKTYSDYKNMKFFTNTLPNILCIAATIYYMKKIQKEKEEKNTGYQDLDTLSSN